MSFLTLKLPSGMMRNGTRYQAKGRWYDGNLVRWFRETLRPIGGWALQSDTDDVLDLEGVPRGALAWEVAGGRAWQGYGTVGELGIDGESLFEDTATGANGTDIGTRGYSPGGGGFCSIQSNEYELTWGGGAVWRARYDTILTDDKFHFYADMRRPPAAASPGNPGISFWYGEGGTVECCHLHWQRASDTTVDVKFHRRDAGGQQDPAILEVGVSLAAGAQMRLGVRCLDGVCTAYRADAGGGNEVSLGVLTISVDWRDGSHRMFGIGNDYAMVSTGITWDDINVFDFQGPAKLYSFSQGILYDVTPTGLDSGDQDTKIGGSASSGFYGAGEYGTGVYGVGQSTFGAVDDADIWHLDTFGNWLIGTMVPNNNEIYTYDPSTPATPAVLLSEAPTNLRGVVITPERFMVALGADGNSRNVAWSDRDNYTEWTPAADNEAGDLILEGGGRLMRGLRGRQETLLWTDTELWTMTYIGGTFIYSFAKRGSHCGLVAPLAVAEINGAQVWMSNRGFFTYDGYVRPLPCDVRDYVFNDMNKDQRIKICSFVNHEFNEVWWFYPSSDSMENNRYVAWNYEENHWFSGRLSRNCGFAATTTSTKPVLLDASGAVYQHEIGTDHSINQPVDDAVPYADTGPIEISERGDRVMHVLEIIPDEANSGQTQFYLFGSFYPNETPVEYGPFSSLDPTPVRMQGRQVQLRVEQTVPEDWRVGFFRLDVQPGGRR